MWTVGQAAKLAGTSRARIYRAVTEGTVKGTLVQTYQLFISAADLVALGMAQGDIDRAIRALNNDTTEGDTGNRRKRGRNRAQRTV